MFTELFGTVEGLMSLGIISTAVGSMFTAYKVVVAKMQVTGL
jgi:hypothetical protein